MTITPQHLIALLPLLIVGLTVVVVMLSIAWRRNHFLNATLSVIGLNAALVSLWFVGQAGAMDVTPLMRVDGFAMLYTGLVLLASLATCTFAYPWLEGYNDNQEEFYLLVLIASLGGILLANANHLAALFLGIELISLPLFGLIGYAFRQKRSLEASIKYTILSAAASSFLLFGMALVYAQSGNLSFEALGKSLGDGMLHEPLLLAGFGLMIVGLGFKLSLVPFHLWTPDVYQGAPAPVSTFLATASKIAIFGVVMRLFLYAPVGDSEAVRVVLGIIAFASIIFGNLMALSQTNIKRLLGYSSISHLGYLLVALIALQSGEMSMEAVGVYLAGYLFSSLGAFGVVSLMSSPFRGGCGFSVLLPWSILAPPGSCRGDDGDDAVAGRYPDDAGLYRQILRAGGRRSGQPVVAGRRRGGGFRDWFVLLPARCGESLPARAAATGTRRADKLAVQRRRYRGADLRVAGVGTGRLAAAAD